jgi:hypothetical protein
MSDPVWRDFGEELPVRRFIRHMCMNGSDGLAVEDLDLVMRRYRPGDDKFGRLRLIEVKYGTTDLGVSKIMTFGLLDTLLRIGAYVLAMAEDTSTMRYDGLYTLRTLRKPSDDHPDPFTRDGPIVKVGNAKLDANGLADWFEFKGPEMARWKTHQDFATLMSKCDQYLDLPRAEGSR